MAKTNQYKDKTATNKKKTTKKSSSKKTEKKESKIVGKVKSFINDDRTQKSVGLVLILSSLYLFICFTSYLFTWKSDYSIIDGKTFGFVFSGDEVVVKNWLGKLGAFTAHKFLKVWFGVSSYVFPFLSFLLGIKILFKITLLPLKKTLKISFVAMVWVSILMAFLFGSPLDFMGGLFGHQIVSTVANIAGTIGAGLFVAFTGYLAVIVLFNPSYEWLGKFVNSINAKDAEFIPEEEKEAINTIKEEEITTDTVSETIDFNVKEPKTKNKVKEVITTPLEIEVEETPLEPTIKEEPTIIKPTETTPPTNDEFEVVVPKEEKVEDNSKDEMEIVIAEDDTTELSKKELNNMVEEFGLFDPKLELSQYQLPNIDLLVDYGDGSPSLNKEELEENKNKIITTLMHYKIEISKIKATIGPTVTLYEIVPAPGVRISKIKNLEDDVALSLAALGIRIIAPMPGKGTVGIEVPNSKPKTVAMRALIASDKFQNSEMQLPVALGKTISNETFVADLAKMPHLLMAGATGQGKSVGLNAILVSILYKKHPSQVKFVLVDPKKVELTLFNKIERHFLAKLPDEEDAIITDTQKVVTTLNSLCVEMDQRYELLKDAYVRNIVEYNEKFVNRKLNPEKGHRYLPYIVLVIDEFADLIMTAGKEVETPIARLAQLARAIGIHLIVATQRPSVNVITGIIKANFPARAAFRVTSKIDSRTILDAGGADQLIGRGDMLFSTGNDLIRLQCGFVDTPEVEKITDMIGSQRAYPEAYKLPEYIDESAEGSAKEIDDQLDGLFEDAAYIIVNQQQGSASLIQRKLKIGYNRAGRIIDQMEATGLIGPHRGSKAREVNIPDVMALDDFLKNLREKGVLGV
ncbi:MAG: DNA translocase FtsK [Flavobacteriales bacterium]|jgi:S-DNA-T family DNA segregation ATPase FtsK/SpoIIIE|nr:DNA translocase FtsK [Flavobacteriales bacterium]